MTKHTIDVDTRYGIGPISDVYGHPTVTTFNQPDEEGLPDQQFLACLDCGYVTDDVRKFNHTDCTPFFDPDNPSPINRSWRAAIREDGYPDHPHLG